MHEYNLVLVHSQYKDKEGNIKNKIATGYYILENVVMTVLHVIEDGLQLNLRVRNSGNREWEGAKILWKDEKLDTLLLSVDQINSNFSKVQLQDSNFVGIVSWHSTGYPKASIERDNEGIEQRNAVGLKGDIHPLGGKGQSDVSYFDLTVDSPPKEVKNWAGISGAPIFVNNVLVGMIKSTSLEYGSRLQGIRMLDLLRTAGFKANLNPDKFKIPDSEKWILVIYSEKSNDSDLKDFVTGARNELLKKDKDPFEIQDYKINSILSNPAVFLDFLKLICVAPILVVDVTGFQPGIMLLLGIRAVVKKGVTITTTFDVISSENLSNLPFNIQEIKMISLDERTDTQLRTLPAKDKIIWAITEGLNHVEHNPRYLDLPTYFAVRNPVVAGIPKIEEKTLLLCPFSDDYKTKLKFIYNRLASYFASDDLIRMLDIYSPQLVGQSLYEHIRWSRICIVDWSYWRPNVFYEFGVRLASSRYGAVNLIDKSSLNKERDNSLSQRDQLLNLFKPFIYQADGTNREFPDDAKDFILSLKKDSVNPSKDRYLHYDQVFHILQEHYDWKQETILKKPYESVKEESEREFGKDIEASGKRNILYSSNPLFQKALQDSMREKWLSAWYYLRYRFKNTDQNDSIIKDYKECCESVLRVLGNKDEKYSEIYTEIVNEIDKLEEKDNE